MFVTVEVHIKLSFIGTGLDQIVRAFAAKPIPQRIVNTAMSIVASGVAEANIRISQAGSALHQVISFVPQFMPGGPAATPKNYQHRDG